jgi:hypothetical protein
MAKKTKALRPTTVVDDEGYETDGMYRWGGPRKKHTADEIENLLDAMVDEHNRPAVDRVRKIREWLNSVIIPHVDGPHDPDKVRCGGVWGRMVHLDLSTGKGLYQLADEVPKHGFVADAIDALNDNYALEQRLAKDDNVNEIVRLAYRQGLLCQRIKMRARFAPTVLSKAEHKRKQSVAQRNRAKLKDAKHRNAVFAFIRNRGEGVSQEGAAVEAAHLLTVGKLPGLPGIVINGIKPKTIQNLYSKRNKAPSRK